MFNKIYANGCSYTNDPALHQWQQPNFIDQLGQHYQVPVQNFALAGSCNRRIIRTTLRDSLTLDKHNLIIMQLTHLERTEKPFTPGQNNHWKMSFNGSKHELHESIKPSNREFEPLNDVYMSAWIKFFDPVAEAYNLATDLLLLLNFLRHRQIPFVVLPYISLLTEQEQSELNQSIISSTLLDLLQNPGFFCSNIFSYINPTFHDDPSRNTLGIGHLDAGGHQQLCQYLINLIDNQLKLQ